MRCHAHRTSAAWSSRPPPAPLQTPAARRHAGATHLLRFDPGEPSTEYAPRRPHRTPGPDRRTGARRRRGPPGTSRRTRPPAPTDGHERHDTGSPVRYRHNARCRHDTHNEIKKPRIAIRHTPVFALSVDDPGVPSAVRSGHAGPMPSMRVRLALHFRSRRSNRAATNRTASTLHGRPTLPAPPLGPLSRVRCKQYRSATPRVRRKRLIAERRVLPSLTLPSNVAWQRAQHDKTINLRYNECARLARGPCAPAHAGQRDTAGLCGARKGFKTSRGLNLEGRLPLAGRHRRVGGRSPHVLPLLGGKRFELD